MTTMIQFGDRKDNTRYLDAEIISTIEVYQSHGGGGFRVSSIKGPIYDIDTKQWGVELEDVLKKLEDAGYPLVALPGKHGDRPYDAYISPRAVVAIDTSAVSKTSGLQGVNVHVEGVGYIESTGSKPADIETLVEAVKATGKNLVTLQASPTQLKTNWYEAGNVYIEPSTIRRINQTGSQLELQFDNAPLLRLEQPYEHDGQHIEEVLKRSKDGDKRDLHDIFLEVSARHKTERQQSLDTTTQQIISAAQGLTHIPAPEQNIYVRPEDFSEMTIWKRGDDKFVLDLTPHRRRDGNYPENVHINYNSEAERAAGIAAFTGKKPATPKAPQPKP